MDVQRYWTRPATVLLTRTLNRANVMTEIVHVTIGCDVNEPQHTGHASGYGS
ncbi:MAG TPA: hypothetical protein VHA06_00465 [Candidatus Angelobacter sp.]|nr:hypothetical protein [Candidatus Angelobacter sp.]